MTLKFLLFGVAFTVYLWVSVRATKAVKETIVLSARKKRMNYVLVWLIPFLWAIFIRGALKETPGYHNAPKEIGLQQTEPGVASFDHAG